MKKVLIIATAMIFAASTVVMASNQKETGKVQPQKTTTPAKQEAQKPAVKTEMAKPAQEQQKPAPMAAQKPAKMKHHKGGMAKTGETKMHKEAPKPAAGPKTGQTQEMKAAAPVKK